MGNASVYLAVRNPLNRYRNSERQETVPRLFRFWGGTISGKFRRNSTVRDGASFAR